MVRSSGRNSCVPYLIIIGIILRIVALQQFPLAPLLFQGLADQLGNLAHLSWFFSPNNKPVEMLREGSTDTVSQLKKMVTFKPEQSLLRLESTMTHVLLVAKRRFFTQPGKHCPHTAKQEKKGQKSGTLHKE